MLSLGRKSKLPRCSFERRILCAAQSVCQGTGWPQGQAQHAFDRRWESGNRPDGNRRLVVIQVDRQPFELLVLVPAWMSSDCCRSRRGFEPHDLWVAITGTGGEFESLLIEDRDDAALVADKFLAL